MTAEETKESDVDKKALYLDPQGLTDREIDDILAAADAMSVDIREKSVPLSLPELPDYLTVALALVSPFLKELARTATPKLADLLGRIFKGRRGQAMELEDRQVFLMWDSVAREHMADAVAATLEVDFDVLPKNTVLEFDPTYRRWNRRDDPGRL